MLLLYMRLIAIKKKLMNLRSKLSLLPEEDIVIMDASASKGILYVYIRI